MGVGAVGQSPHPTLQHNHQLLHPRPLVDVVFHVPPTSTPLSAHFVSAWIPPSLCCCKCQEKLNHLSADVLRASRTNFLLHQLLKWSVLKRCTQCDHTLKLK